MTYTEKPEVEARKPPSRPARPTLARQLKRLIVIAAATYVAVCLGVAVLQKHLIYFPAPDYHSTPADIGLVYKEVTLVADDGVSLAAWFVPADGAELSVIFCHGNAGNISDRLSTIQTLHMLGLSVLVFDYRGYGHSEGSPSERGTYADAEAAWEYVTTDLGVPPERIVIVGRSLGGAVAIELARRHRPCALVVESTFTRLADVGGIHYPLLPSRWLLVHRYDSFSKVPAIDCPKLFLHGRDDQLIPIALGRSLFDAAAEPKRFIETPSGHNEAGLTYSSEYTNELAAFLREARAATSR